MIIKGALTYGTVISERLKQLNVTIKQTTTFSRSRSDIYIIVAISIIVTSEVQYDVLQSIILIHGCTKC